MKRTASLLLVVAALNAVPAPARAATFIWTGATDGNWATGTNWDTGMPASAIDTAIVFNNETQLATNNNIAGGLTLNSLLLGPNSGVRALTGNTLVFDGASPSIVQQNVLGVGSTVIQTPIQMNQTLSVSGGVDFNHQLAFASTAVFSGPGGLVWNSGVGFNNAANTYSGPTLVAAGALGVGKNGAFGSSATVTVQSGAGLQLQGGITINKPLSLAGSGFGGLPALHSSNLANTWSGPITLASDATVSAILTGSLAISGSISLGGNDLTVGTSANAPVALSGPISGAGGITKTGAGTATFSSPSSAGHNYSGPTLISEGAAVAASNSAFAGSSVSVASGATIALLSSITVGRPLSLAGTLRGLDGNSSLNTSAWSGIVTLAGDGVYAATGGQPTKTTRLTVSGQTNLNGHTLNVAPATDSANNTVSITGPITGSGAVVFGAGPGSASLTLGPASGFTGPVTVNGNLALNGNGTIGDASNPVSLTGGLANVNFTGTVGAQSWNITGTGGAVLGGNNFGVLNAGISGVGPLSVTTGLRLGGLNSFTGGLIASATVSFTSESNLGDSAGAITLAGGSLLALADTSLSASRTFVATGISSLAAPSGVAFIVPNNISGTGRIIIAGSSGGLLGGTVRLDGNNTHDGGSEILGATLEAAQDSAFGGPSGVLNIGRENGLTDISGRLTALGNISVPATRSTTFRLATVNTNGFDITFNQPISGLGLVKEGLGVLRLNTANSSVAAVNDVSITGGTLRLGTAEALGRPRVTLAGTTLDLNGFDQTVSFLGGPGEVMLGGGTLRLIGGSSIDAVVSGPGNVIFGKTGLSPDSYRVLADNTFTGQVAIVAGNRVSVRGTAGFGADGNAVLLDNGGIESDSTAVAPVVIGPSFPLIIGSGGAFFGASGVPLIIGTQLTGANSIGVLGGGTGYEVRFAHPNNTFAANLQIGDNSFGDAVLGIVADGSLGNPANIVTLGYSFFDGESTRTGNGTLRAFADVVLPVTRDMRLAGGNDSSAGGKFDTNGFDVTIAGAIMELDPQTPLRKTGEGTLYLNGANTYTGGTTVEAGTLGGTGVIAWLIVNSSATLAPGNSPGALHTGDLTLAGGSTLSLDFASPTLADQLDVTGSVTLGGDVELLLSLAYIPTGPDAFVVIANDQIDPVNTGGLFTIAGNQLEEGELFSAAGIEWRISYQGGTGNDVTLTTVSVVPEPAGALALAAGLMLLAQRRGRGRAEAKKGLSSKF